jgi:hypothetical protein
MGRESLPQHILSKYNSNLSVPWQNRWHNGHNFEPFPWQNSWHNGLVAKELLCHQNFVAKFDGKSALTFATERRFATDFAM